MSYCQTRKVTRRDAYDLERNSIHIYTLTDRLDCTAETIDPVTVANNNNRSRACLIVRRNNRSAGFCVQSERLKVIPRDELPLHHMRIPNAGNDGFLQHLECKEVSQARLSELQSLEGRIRESVTSNSPISLVHVTVPADSLVVLPWKPQFNALVYVLTGDGFVGSGEQPIHAHQLAQLGPGQSIQLRAAKHMTDGTGALDVLVFGGLPIREPIASYGPFVMNDEEGIRQAFADYRTTGFGGWPWPVDDPVHPREASRFARHADGHVEQPARVDARS